jgi:hypothetical protein
MPHTNTHMKCEQCKIMNADDDYDEDEWRKKYVLQTHGLNV